MGVVMVVAARPNLNNREKEEREEREEGAGSRHRLRVFSWGLAREKSTVPKELLLISLMLGRSESANVDLGFIWEPGACGVMEGLHALIAEVVLWDAQRSIKLTRLHRLEDKAICMGVWQVSICQCGY